MFPFKDARIKSIIDSWNAINHLSNVFDESVIKTNCWFLLGSGKPNNISYNVTHIYNIQIGKNSTVKLNEIDLLPKKEMCKKLSNFMVSKNCKLKENDEVSRLMNSDPSHNLYEVSSHPIDNLVKTKITNKCSIDTIATYISCFK